MLIKRMMKSQLAEEIIGKKLGSKRKIIILRPMFEVINFVGKKVGKSGRSLKIFRKVKKRMVNFLFFLKF